MLAQAIKSDNISSPKKVQNLLLAPLVSLTFQRFPLSMNIYVSTKCSRGAVSRNAQ